MYSEYLNLKKNSVLIYSNINDIVFDNVLSGSLEYNTSTGLIKLLPFITYEILGYFLFRIISSTCIIEINVFDEFLNIINTSSPLYINGLQNQYYNGHISCILTPITTLHIKLRIFNIIGWVE